MELCRNSCLRLHKFVSNSKDVLKCISLENRAKGLTGIDIQEDKLLVERTLGVLWYLESESF